MKPHIGISDKKLKDITSMLSDVLADEMVLYIKTRKFHWNVKGDSFMELHKLFEVQYTQLEKAIDEIAERINKLGSDTIGTLKEFSSRSSLKESPGIYPTGKDMIRELLDDHENSIIALRKNVDKCADSYGDMGTADFLTGLMVGHESTAWTLRRYFK